MAKTDTTPGTRGALLIGYDVEASEAPEKTARFLEIALRVHTELEAPCTLFIVGKVLEANPEAFQRISGNPLFDLEQHTYSHMRLKPVSLVQDGKATVLDCGTPEQVREEIETTNELFLRYLGGKPLGLTGPYANLYENGLADVPEMLRVIHDCGIRFLRCYGREGNNLPLDVQPFWYRDHGYPDILEFPMQGFVWGRRKEDIPEILYSTASQGYTWDNVQHEWDVVDHDSQMTEVRMMVTEARKLGTEVMSYLDYYHRLNKERAEDKSMGLSG